MYTKEAEKEVKYRRDKDGKYSRLFAHDLFTKIEYNIILSELFVKNKIPNIV